VLRERATTPAAEKARRCEAAAAGRRARRAPQDVLERDDVGLDGRHLRLGGEDLQKARVASREGRP
jgi:hypothetical protein